MFTGIIETLGTIKKKENEGSNVHFTIESSLGPELKVDQSVAHDGVCLTVIEISGNLHRVTAVDESLKKTNMRFWEAGKAVNLERALLLSARLDGHLVQGHVDTTGICIQKEELEGSTNFSFSYPEEFAALLIEKGSICINGVSLTAFQCGKNEFTVTIIPYTIGHTNFKEMQVEDLVNLEFDVLGKYILRSQQIKG